MNNDLISRSALLELSFSLSPCTVDNPYNIAAAVLVDDIEAAPAVDAVEVVRCKDCIYNDSETHIPGFVYCIFWDSTKDFDGYCDDGERRDDGT